MRRALWSWCLFLIVVAVATVATTYAAVPRGEPAPTQAASFAGTWSGTWDGSGSGGFELTLESKESAYTGRVSVTGEPTYRAVFKSVTFEGMKMTALYDFPPDESGEVLLTATFDGNTAVGTWALRAKGATEPIASGGWKVTKK